MSEKIRIGENEYQPNFGTWGGVVGDANGRYIPQGDVLSALNELAALRQERDGLKARVEELDRVAAFWCFKCDVLARWFDAEQKNRPEWQDTTVQDDLRKFRDILGRFSASRSNPTTKGGE